VKDYAQRSAEVSLGENYDGAFLVVYKTGVHDKFVSFAMCGSKNAVALLVRDENLRPNSYQVFLLKGMRVQHEVKVSVTE